MSEETEAEKLAEAEEETPAIKTTTAPAGTASAVTAPGTPVTSSAFTLPGSSPAAAKPKPVKAKVKFGRSKMPPEMWIEIKTLYETGSYSQSDLVAFCKGRGFRIGQPAISRRCMDEGWVRGREREKISKEIYDKIQAEKGEHVIKMLNLHRGQSEMVLAEAMFYFRKSAETRKLDPMHTIPAVQLATLTQVIKDGQSMQARALGFNYKEGRPFRGDDEDEAQKPTVLEIRDMTDDQVAEARAKAERAAKGEEEESS
jgi:hypothetical protein